MQYRIVVIVPPRSSGTRAFLRETVMNGGDFSESVFTAVTTREVVDLVAQSPLAIGVLSEGFVKMNPGKVKVVKIKPITRSSASSPKENRPGISWLSSTS